ncbi:MAG: maleylpyruvate isomerase family mycothiol-dependent enzyme [Kineosporiaceae bacterium]|nr:maleylpyruvate isomerase family mycothiol-dependent enzyme [Kineosporiaceae bacterium]MBK7624399.1 maleylpyruvate isomerase family mycothiol-dependent enzyme [Kineosporiaceae bacterium]MBK8077766.1 maleylpyruvate isomerase family mycothiol-dependent enzyme [Kineosporiaceae bacterium]
MDVWAEITDERVRLADLLDGLDEFEWATASLCSGWTVRDMAGHLVMPLATPHPIPRFLVDMIRARGSFDRVNRMATARFAVRPTTELVDLLRRHAGSHFVAPTMPPTASLAEILVHGQDIRVPLGVDDAGPVQRWTAALGFLLTPAARRGFVGGRLPALRWLATDAEWSGLSGSDGAAPEGLVSGPASAVGLAIMGRRARLGELSGDGVPVLTRWLDR